MILFLDIDGVMVPAKGHKLPELLQDGFPAFSSKATTALNTLLSTYDATVMLTTSHKSRYTIEEWKQIFSKRGINVGKMETLPPNTDNLSRVQEIQQWFVMNESPAFFIILDDDKSLNALPAYLKESFILTSPYIGLTEEHVTAVAEVMHREEFA